jgi:hypothetical protein
MLRLCYSAISVALIFTLAACERPGDRPLLIAPFLQGAYYCAGAEDVPENLTDDEAAKYCADRHLTGAPRIEAALAKIGPSVSPSGNYQLGYTLIVPLMRYFKQHDSQWVLDREELRNGLSTISGVNRKVVVYLSANHFTDAGVKLSAELARDPANLMWTRSGPMFPDSYFDHPIVAWSLSDPDAPITKLRREVFKAAVEEICQLPKESQDRIAAVSVLGEVHQMYSGFVDGPRYGVSVVDATDYSPTAVRGFKWWLRDRFKTVEALNKRLGSAFVSFDEVTPPSKDMHTEQVSSLLEHLDNYAAGSLPVYGWIHDKAARALNVSVRVDGAPVGEAEMGLSRTDVTDAVPAIENPNIGFKYVLDFTKLSPGPHTLDAVLKVDGTAERLIAKRAFVVGPAGKAAAANQTPQITPMTADPALTGYLDGPAENTSVIFNPMALLWLEYRNFSVTRYVESFASIARDSCIPQRKIFSHQITPGLTGSWNGDLIAVDDAMRPNSLFNPGATLYGGAAFGSAFVRMKERLGWDRYGVSEMHPVTKLSSDGYRAMFEMHRKSGAVFVAPYYAVVTPNVDLSGEGLKSFLLDAKNPKAGSAAFYEAIADAVNKQ